MLRYSTIPMFAAESGYTQEAIRSKIRDEIWKENEVWKRAPDGRVLIDREGYEKWVEMDAVLGSRLTQASKSRSRTRVGAVGRGSLSSPLPLT